ncbi:hypothetical protein RHMOL_Rhmol09G0000400 [Rhododendron molle]|uniref:Uncharacterized protein n=2 Tax=Rhododendron molle TaxID=49168 RepID=A0ACC0M932_RHOML|nr:hypothetical protein RHMOL_Rhmol09G0000400 [Rhododendron molle]KAI8537110.1 hypothetical protein RHMOL_Rhmol09G0000400 [Rhododendron molle]
MATVWHQWIRKSIQSSSTLRAVHTLKVDPSQPMLKSPPLISLDLPDVWTSNVMDFDPPSIGECSNERRARVIDGKLMAEKIRAGIAGEVIRMKESIGKVPGLAVILVGHRRDSQTYVRNKRKACEEAGIKFAMAILPDSCTKDEVCEALSSFNGNPSVHDVKKVVVVVPIGGKSGGCLGGGKKVVLRVIEKGKRVCREGSGEVNERDDQPQQLRLEQQCAQQLHRGGGWSAHLDEEKILNLVSLEKDVDGFHPLNMGNLAMRGREPLFIPCTPKGCIELLVRSGVDIMGKKAVRHHATVSTVHALTSNPEQITREADIVISAAGVPNLVRGTWLKPGAVVIDVGTCPVEDPNSEHGYRLMGDVCYEEAVMVASAITPVPGGVGPMTIAMLLVNTLNSAKRAFNFH